MAAKEKISPKRKKSMPRTLFFGPVEIPIRQQLCDYDLEFIPSHDEHYKIDVDQLVSLAIAVKCNEPVMLVGPTGCGKTSLVKEFAAILNQPLQRANLHGDVRVSHFVGEKILTTNKNDVQIIKWIDGILPRAMRLGHWLLLDEIDASTPQVLEVLKAVLESSERRLVLLENDGEIIKPHPEFRLFATANTLGKGDESGLYAGTNILNEAFLDRFETTLECDYLPRKDEIDVLVGKTNVDKDIATKMVQVASLIRDDFKISKCFLTFSTRKLLSWARKANIMNDPIRPCYTSILNKLSKEDREYVCGVLQRVFGRSF